MDRGAITDAALEAERLLPDAVDHADAGREGQARALLAHALQGLGEIDAAAREVELSLGLPLLMPFLRAVTLARLAAIRLAQGRTVEALAAAREAMEEQGPSPARAPWEPFIRLVHVEALTAAGEHDEALAALTLARDRLVATAARISDPALRRSFLEDVPDNARTLRLAEERLGRVRGTSS